MNIAVQLNNAGFKVDASFSKSNSIKPQDVIPASNNFALKHKA